MTLASIVALAAAGTEPHGNVALETIGYGITALVVFAALALVTLSYRHVANRHPHKAAAYARTHVNDTHESGHGH